MLKDDNTLISSEWEVADVPIQVGRHIVKECHYARGASNTRVYLHGLFKAGTWTASDCIGVAWWIPPTKTAAIATYPQDHNGVLALSRVAIFPSAPKNAASFLVGRSMSMIDRRRWPCLVTYADEWRGHTGQIYKATNWQQVGKTKPERVYCREGRMVSRKAGQKTRTHQQMLDIGAECMGAFSKFKFVHIKT